MKRPLVVLVTCLMILVFALSACGGDEGATTTTAAGEESTTTTAAGEESTTTAAAVEEQLLTISLPTAIVSGDPSLTDSTPAVTWFYAVFDGLFTFDSGGNLIGAIATDSQVSDDGLTETITIREGVTFQDGSPLTAADVQFTIDRVMDEDRGAPLRGDLGAIDSVEVDGDYRVILHLNKPAPTLDQILAGPTGLIVPKAYVEAVGDEAFAAQPIGAGPFRFVGSSEGGQVYSLEAYDGYWQGPPILSDLTIRVVSEPATQISMLKSGQVDLVLGANATQVASLDPSDFTVVAHPAGEVHLLHIRMHTPPFDDVRVRQALNLATDRQIIIDTLYGGYAVTVGALSAPGWDGYDESLEAYPYDPEQARALLEEAEYDFDSTIGLLMPRDRWANAEEAMQALISDWANVGINVELEIVDYGRWLEILCAGEESTAPILTLTNSVNRFDDPINQLDGQVACGFSCSRICVEEYDEVMNAAAVLGGEERTEGIKAWNQLHHDEAPFVFLWGPLELYAMRSSVNVELVDGCRDLMHLETASNNVES